MFWRRTTKKLHRWNVPIYYMHIYTDTREIFLSVSISLSLFLHEYTLSLCRIQLLLPNANHMKE